ncbi:hypothetical protein ACCS34_36790, partial [Rhizobium ruizarguesonis]
LACEWSSVVCSYDIFSIVSETFFTLGKILNIVRQAAPILFVAIAMTFVIITGVIDLSVGSLDALVIAVAAIIMAMGV